MAPANKSRHGSVRERTHIVLVPGFGGFDALGQMEYYAGTTPHFERWKTAGGAKRRSVTLHYFDNFPTAAVATRAQRLRSYLAKRIARGEFLPGDSIALVGLSTGGLDIRRLLCDLAAGDQDVGGTLYSVDGTQGTDFAVAPAEILDRVKGVVFLSVPQFGTNIADWVGAHALGRYALIADLRASVATSQLPVFDRLQRWLTLIASGATDLDLLLAMQDALTEAEPPSVEDAMRTLMAQEAASELALWLRHICSDFSAIEDLSAKSGGDAVSPAHFTIADREREKAGWKEQNIVTKSYATLGARPFDFDPEHAAPRWDLLHPWSYPETTSAMRASTGTDVVYRTCYRACAGGPFEYPDIGMAKPSELVDENGEKRSIAVWDNDGIVNTASMLWPNLGDTILVNADHMDIVGHFRRVPSLNSDNGRDFDAYDLLKSNSGFDSTTFGRVWDEVFEFCSS